MNVGITREKPLFGGKKMDITITQEYTTLAIIDYLYYSKWAPGKYNDLK